MVCDVLLITVLSTLTFSQILAEDAVVSSQLSGRQLDNDLNTRNVNDAENLDEELWNSKRASAFMPLRGRKDAFDEKRSSFMPLRGKKERFDLYEDTKRTQGFMPLRGRRDYGDYEGFYYPAIYNPELKRTSSFMPLRGKKDDSTDKRASFHALRGKKDVHYEMINDGLRSIYGKPPGSWMVHETQPMDEKRAKSAFYGLRGKRSIHL